MTTPPLDALTKAVLAYLGVAAAAPSRELLDALVPPTRATVPWESASRIAKRARTAEIADCPRWPEAFWHETFARGTGGTCFESNYAFFSLLRALGYEGYLTINNMGDTLACHTAIVILLDGQRWLTDVGMPIYLPLPFGPESAQSRRTEFQTYTVRPDGRGRLSGGARAAPEPELLHALRPPDPGRHLSRRPDRRLRADGLLQ